MKKLLLFNIACVLVAVLFVQDSRAQNYARLGLPNGAKARLGKGLLSGLIAYSPDGTRLAVVSAIGIWIYDTYTGAEVALITGYTAYVESVAFAPDGKTIASANSDSTVWLWDVNTAQLKTPLEHTARVESVAFAPDGKTIASASADGKVRLWDVNTAQLKITLDLEGHESSVYSVAFSPDGTTLASTDYDNTMRLWDVASGQLKNIIIGHTMAVTLDGKIIAYADWETVQLWDASAQLKTTLDLEGHESSVFLPEHQSSVFSVAFAPDGKTIAGAGYDNTVWLWDVATGQLKNTLVGHTVAFSPDGTTLAITNRHLGLRVWDGIISASTDYNTVRLWDMASGQLKNTLVGHTDEVDSMVFAPDGKTIASASAYDGTVRLWDAETGQLKISLDHFNFVFSVAFAPDGKTIASAVGDKAVRLWDAETGQLKNTLEWHAGGVLSVAFAPDGKTIASASADGIIQLWDVASGQLKNTMEGHTYQVYSVAFSPDGTTLASTDYDTVRLWDAETGQLKISLDHFNFVLFIAFSFSPDGTILASADSDGTIRLWDTATEQPQAIFGTHGDAVYSVAFSPDGTILASAGSDGTIRLWDVASGQLKNTMEGHTYYGHYGESVAFSPDGTTLASIYYGTIRLWDMATGQLKNTLGHTYQVFSVAFSPDGATLASSSPDGTILLWDMSPYITPSAPTAVELSPTLPTHTSLLANFPNPFNPNTYIPYQLHAPAHVRLTIYDIRGALIREIDLGYQQAGQYLTSTSAAHWDGRDQRGQRVASGVYVYQLQAGPIVHGRKMLLVK